MRPIAKWRCPKASHLLSDTIGKPRSHWLHFKHRHKGITWRRSTHLFLRLLNSYIVENIEHAGWDQGTCLVCQQPKCLGRALSNVLIHWPPPRMFCCPVKSSADRKNRGVGAEVSSSNWQQELASTISYLRLPLQLGAHRAPFVGV